MIAVQPLHSMHLPLPWLLPTDPLPDVHGAWGADSPAPGLLAAGTDLGVARLVEAYGKGIFPWFSPHQPVLWWSPHPRMVLDIDHFRLHRSLRKSIARLRQSAHCEIRIDHGFRTVMAACASKPRHGQTGTWIVPEMIEAYTALHAAGHAHSVETWIDGQLAGGLYCVAIGKAVFGESMFAHRSDASKIALAALVALCRAQGAAWIDCQQNTAHLAFLGAREIDREAFLARLARARAEPALEWSFDPLYWDTLLAGPNAQA